MINLRSRLRSDRYGEDHFREVCRHRAIISDTPNLDNMLVAQKPYVSMISTVEKVTDLLPIGDMIVQ